jgi:hypothetical protein
MSVQPKLARPPARRTKRETIPASLRAEVAAFSKLLMENFAAFFTARPRARFQVARLLAGELPPLRRPAGRPGFPAVTKACQMLAELGRLHPGEPARILWPGIYREVIEGYALLSKPERRAAAQELRDRVRWRRRAQRRAQARKIQHPSSPLLH